MQCMGFLLQIFRQLSIFLLVFPFLSFIFGRLIMKNPNPVIGEKERFSKAFFHQNLYIIQQ